MECHLQIFLDNEWVDCAQVEVRDAAQGNPLTPSTFEYRLDYAFGKSLEPVSLAYPVDAELRHLTRWPAFLYDLVPQGSGRTFLLGQLGLSDGPAADFPLMCAGAFNPIGRTRIREATEYFHEHVDRHDAESMAQGFSFSEILQRGELFHERMMIHSMLAAGSSGVQGAAPKYLLTRDKDGNWHADGALPDDRAAAHFIVKLPRGKTAADKKVLRNEAAYMAVAQAMGIRTHAPLEYHEDMLLIPRFDRVVAGQRVVRQHQESAASVAGIVGFDMRPSQFELLQAIRRVVSDKTTETIEFLTRDVLNLAMRNTDNHARNTALQKQGDGVRLTPLFDFAPMYLDPEGVPRAARWYHPETRKELTQWRDVVAALDVETAERVRIVQALREFGAGLSRLEEHMQQAAIESDIIDYLKPNIAEQMRQLNELGKASMVQSKKLAAQELARQRRAGLYEAIARNELSLQDAVKQMRKISQLTQAEFAAHRGVSTKVIKDIERDLGNPTIGTLKKIGQFFGLEVAFVRRAKPDMPVSVVDVEESMQLSIREIDAAIERLKASVEGIMEEREGK